MNDDAPPPRIDPEILDQGTATVQETGYIYVGRKHAGTEVRWWMEDTGASDD